MSMTNDENNHFPIGYMIVKGEYLTHDNNARKKGGYVSCSLKLTIKSVDHAKFLGAQVVINYSS